MPIQSVYLLYICAVYLYFYVDFLYQGINTVYVGLFIDIRDAPEV